MNPKLIVIIAFSYMYLFFEMLMSRRQTRRRTIDTSGDRGSIWVLILSIFIGYALAFGIGATTLGRVHYWNAFFAAGVVLVVTGLCVRITAVLTLKTHFSYTMSNWLSVLGMMLPVATGFLYRISVEEQFMQAQLGQTYVEYKERTHRLIPTLY